MKSESVIVPRMLIKNHGRHPEDYGESIVILMNGMYTDVYTNESGDLYTVTNDPDLIKHLKETRPDNQSVSIEKEDIKIRSIQFEDAGLLKKWMNSNDNWLLQGQDYSDEEIRIYVSHAITYESHSFIVEIDDKPTGTISYELHEEDLLFDLRVYEKITLNDDAAMNIFNLIKSHMDRRLNYQRMLAHVLEEDEYHRLLYVRLGFKRVDELAFDTPVIFER